jgi:predicted secreted protein
MTWFTFITGYLMTWWLTLFMTLPLWVAPSEPGEPGHQAGAPRRPLLGRKLALNTVLAAIVWLGIYLLIRRTWVSFHGPANF